MKKIIKNRIFIVIITLVIGTGLGVYGATKYQASEVIYNPSNGEPTNVNDALNYLYENINTGGCDSSVAPPEIKGNLIPITISNDGTVKYADTSKKWYNYCNKEWANAVILEDNKTYKVGDTIPEEDIESYFVWIPRFRYKLWNTGTAIKTAHSIEIKFETKETTPSTGSNNGEWLTHPAFTSFNTNGFWVGKFETGYSALPSTNQQTYPGTYGDGNTYNNVYNTEIGYQASTTGNISGIYDMSGGAWEYVAGYMSGKVGSSGFTTTTISEYDSKYFDVYNASSSETSFQYRILGDATGEMGPFKSYSDGDGSARYHNSWYSDHSAFVYSSNPWFIRGGRYYNGVHAGQFVFVWDTGVSRINYGFRLVLTP